MKLVAMMLVRNEDWILEASLNAALRWCDHVCVLDDASDDDTQAIVHRVSNLWPSHVTYQKHFRIPGTPWDEMDLRESLFTMARSVGGTHFAIIDGDEILTADLHESVKESVAKLKPGVILRVPMRAMRTLDQYQEDETIWSRAEITLAFADRVNLSWQPAGDGYQHHHREPHGAEKHVHSFARTAAIGGVMHLQFANRRRLLAKHVLYRMVDHLRWPGRETPIQLNSKYDEALKYDHLRLRPAPASWWHLFDKGRIKLEAKPWQEDEIVRLLETHGRERFAALDLKHF